MSRALSHRFRVLSRRVGRDDEAGAALGHVVGLVALALSLVCALLGPVASRALAAGDANKAECPAATEATPGFRAYLPDCRAYELVTPPYKEGFELTGLGALSGDGSHVIVGGIGAFAGSAGTSAPFEPNVYELSRVEGLGWVPSPLAPATSEFSAGEFIFGGVSADVSKTLWVLHTPEQSIFVHDLYLRGQDGSFTKIGPGFPESVTNGPTGPEILAPQLNGHKMVLSYFGVSPDLTHVLYGIPNETPGALWPGDTTVAVGSVSLYEYVGTGNAEPVLVGVKNEGRLKGQPHVNEGADLISQCGTRLGSGNSAYNAISENGGRVFFTPQGKDRESCGGVQPPVQELYVRENESKTMPISGRSPFDCTGSCATSPPADANFEGASRDGSQAFFTSTQQLLNNASEDTESTDSAFTGCSETIGAGGCNLYEYDFNNEAGHNLALVSGGNPGGAQVQGVARISQDGSHVYFVAKGKLTGKDQEGREPVEGEDNMYVFERDERYLEGHTSFIATLSEEDGAVWGHEDNRPVEATPDGLFLIFPSHEQLTPDDHSSAIATQLFEYDAQRGRLSRVSIGQQGSYECPTTKKMEEGFNCDGNIQAAANTPTLGEENPSFAGGDFGPSVESRSLAVSGDGLRVVFQSPDALTPEAVSSQLPGCANIYEYASGAAGVSGNVYLVSDGKDLSSQRGRCGALKPHIDSTGEDVFFETGDRLVPQDTDTQRDFYAARIGGGFPAPVSPVGCEGDACQGALRAPLALPGAGSATQAGGGNLAPPPVAKPKPKPKSLTRAQKLAKALKACKKKPKKKRRSCKAQARKRYGSAAKASKRNRRAQ